MSVFAAAFEIPATNTDSIEHLKRQALYRLADMIPTGTTITGDWEFTPRSNGGKFWLIAQAPATGGVAPSLVTALADFVRADIPDMAAWIDAATTTVPGREGRAAA